MRCGGCRHWKQVVLDRFDEGDEPDVLIDLGFCMAAEGEPVDAAPRSRDKTPYLRQRDLDDIGTRSVVPCDGSGYAAALLTRDNFGCVLFEAGTHADKETR